jgi:hypothetical protein
MNWDEERRNKLARLYERYNSYWAHLTFNLDAPPRIPPFHTRELTPSPKIQARNVV